MKRKGSESELGQSSCTMINSLSTHTNAKEAELSGSESATLQQMTSPGQVVQLNVTEHEDNEPRKEDLQRITELMDGFKASKVNG